MIDLIEPLQFSVYEHRRAYWCATCTHIGNGNRVYEGLAGRRALNLGMIRKMTR